jgi:hypothetical protein
MSVRGGLGVEKLLTAEIAEKNLFVRFFFANSAAFLRELSGKSFYRACS